jgi:hypothetical protein
MPGQHTIEQILNAFFNAPETKATAVNDISAIKVPVDLNFIKSVNPNSVATPQDLTISGDPATISLHVGHPAVLIDASGIYMLATLEAR